MRQVVKVKVGNRFCGGQGGVFFGSFEAAAPALVDLQLTKFQQELSVGPLVLHGLMFEGFPLGQHVRESEGFEMGTESLERTVGRGKWGLAWAERGLWGEEGLGLVQAGLSHWTR